MTLNVACQFFKLPDGCMELQLHTQCILLILSHCIPSTSMFQTRQTGLCSYSFNLCIVTGYGQEAACLLNIYSNNITWLSCNKLNHPSFFFSFIYLIRVEVWGCRSWFVLMAFSRLYVVGFCLRESFEEKQWQSRKLTESENVEWALNNGYGRWGVKQWKWISI